MGQRITRDNNASASTRPRETGITEVLVHPFLLESHTDTSQTPAPILSQSADSHIKSKSGSTSPASSTFLTAPPSPHVVSLEDRLADAEQCITHLFQENDCRKNKSTPRQMDMERRVLDLEQQVSSLTAQLLELKQSISSMRRLCDDGRKYKPRQRDGHHGGK